MGLDMFLYESHYIGEEYPHKESKVTVTVKGIELNVYPVTYIRSQVMYWRKANQIFAWLNRNVCDIENGVDLSVSSNELIRLQNDCSDVLANHDIAESKLPTQEGFFFGSDLYDEYYIQDLIDTVEAIEKLKLNLEDYREFIFNANW